MDQITKIIATMLVIFSLLSADGLAYLCGLDIDEFEYFAQVVEAESDRSSECTVGKVLIASTIWNRVDSSYFPNTVQDVLNEPGQFTTTHGGRCDMQATNSSRLAVTVAYFMKKLEVIPSNILFFNCIGYNGYTPYGYFGGNYFMTYGKEN